MTKSSGEKPVVQLDDDFFGCIFNCAIRYCLGRTSYMPSLITEQITPLLPYLSSKTLWCFDQDITEQAYEGGYGMECDKETWKEFHQKVIAERVKRGDDPYKTWRTENRQYGN